MFERKEYMRDNRYPCDAANVNRIAVLKDEVNRLRKYETAIVRQGRFGRLFLEYSGDSRGPVGRVGAIGGNNMSRIDMLEKEVSVFPAIKDVDDERWIPVNEDALRDIIALCKSALSKIVDL